MSNKRVRGLAIHRPILYGSTSTPLTPAEKLAAPPDHTHKWTVAVRSAASHPLPSLSAISGASNNAIFEPGSEISAFNSAAGLSGSAIPSTQTTPGSAATISTRGRDQEHDYHKMVGGKDDISHFIKRVQFKLHDTYSQPTRNIDKPPFSVTETGWGEFEIQIKVFFVPEANEKPITLFHHLKLHPWLQQVAAVGSDQALSSLPPSLPPAGTSAPIKAQDTSGADEQKRESSTEASEPKQEPGTDTMDVDSASVTVLARTIANNDATATSTDASAPSAPPKPALPPVVHSWQYDEIVFPEPMEPLYDVLSMHPPTPLPALSALSFSDPSAYRSYQYAVGDVAQGKATTPSPIPPHPLHTPTGYLFDAMSIEAQQSEGRRIDMARIAAIRELERGRDQLIKAEKALKDARNRIIALNNAAFALGNASAAVPPAS
ncbi:probable Protein AF-9 homolog [Melanopsichium pennsylvanicum]|uniref:Protein AF-9 homolog n=2 Tax=Melanopsichium pennsylvanicum TaxID=63383 RepID=A0AAJ5C3D9_9BASI|nr:related to YAF9-Component of a chromatin modifying complex [Melanopsichium pennsylvanicum 4]SNX82515.1 probable Protein AF-9 homolog [Melanopsichium pennsylvanicum]